MTMKRNADEPLYLYLDRCGDDLGQLRDDNIQWPYEILKIE